MSYFTNYQDNHSLFCKSDDDDIPMISHGRYEHNVKYAHQGDYQRGNYQHNREEPKVTNLERLLKEAIERTDRQAREWEEIFDGKIESYSETPSETFAHTDEHVNDIEANGANNFDSNDYIANSSNLVFQDEFDYEIDDREEEEEAMNHPFQNSHSVDFVLTGDSDWEDSDDEEEELEIKEEKMEEEVEDALIMPIFEVVSLPVESTIVNEKREKEVESIENKLEEVCRTIQDNEHAVVMNQISPMLDFSTLDEELQLLLGFDDEDLNMLKTGEVELMTEEELLGIMELSIDKSHLLNEDFEELKEDDHMLIKNPLEVLPANLKFHPLPCNRDDGFEFVKEPKPPDDWSKRLVGLIFVCAIEKLNVVHEQMKKLPGQDKERGIGSNQQSDKCTTFHLSSGNYGLEGDPGNMEMVVCASLEVTCGGFSRRYWGMVRLINKPPKKKWRVDVHVMTLYWERFSRNDLTTDDFLPCEYDWKGGGSLMEDPT